jgi:hypothetical protein
VTSYANTSADVADIIKAVSKNKPDWETAQKVFTLGKNSYRNLLPVEGKPISWRIMGLSMSANRGKEAYFLAAENYANYPDKGQYAYKPLHDALYAEGDFAAGSGKYSCCGVRQSYVSALSRFHGPIYYFHEADAGVLKAFANKDGAGIGFAYDELDDAVALLLAPRVVKKRDGSFAISGRVAPGYNFWDWSSAVAKDACAARSNKPDTPKKLLAALLAAKATVDPTKNTDGPTTSANYAAALLVAQRHVAATFVRAALKAAKDASSNYRSRPSASKCSTECGISESNLAAAHAYWYVIESGLATLGANPAALKAARDLVDPALVNASRTTFSTFATAVKTAVEGAGYSYKKDVWLC